jgi:hypothetical protein
VTCLVWCTMHLPCALSASKSRRPVCPKSVTNPHTVQTEIFLCNIRRSAPAAAASHERRHPRTAPFISHSLSAGRVDIPRIRFVGKFHLWLLTGGVVTVAFLPSLPSSKSSSSSSSSLSNCNFPIVTEFLTEATFACHTACV